MKEIKINRNEMRSNFWPIMNWTKFYHSLERWNLAFLTAAQPFLQCNQFSSPAVFIAKILHIVWKANVEVLWHQDCYFICINATLPSREHPFCCSTIQKLLSSVLLNQSNNNYTLFRSLNNIRILFMYIYRKKCEI